MDTSRAITIRLELSRGNVRLLLAALFVLTSAGDLASESVSLTTYYPAPSGVYTQMITTDVTWLARDTGISGGSSAGKVIIGQNTNSADGLKFYMTGGNASFNGRVGVNTTANPTNHLTVNGGASVGSGYTGNASPTDGMIVQGNIGVGTTNPGTTKLSVVGNGAGTWGSQIVNTAGAGLYIHGAGGYGSEPLRVRSNSTFFAADDAGGSARFAINNDGTTLNFYGNDGGWFNYMSVYNNGQREVNFNVNVGVFNSNPSYPLDVGGTIRASGHVISSAGGCWAASVTPNAVACSGSYGTTVAGHWGQYVGLGGIPYARARSDTPGGIGVSGVTDFRITVICCPNP